jgi:hypothetical protein
MKFTRTLAALGLLLSAHLAQAAPSGCVSSADCFDSAQGRWYKGNTHAHAGMLLRGIVPHGDSSPASVAMWYRDHGYDFAVITDHNRLTDPAAPALERVQSRDFVLIPGVEITSDYRFPGATQEGERAIHTTALNVREAPSSDFANTSSRDILKAHVERTRAAGGITIVNHPNYHGEIKPVDMLGLEGLHLFEVFNGEIEAHNDAAPGRLSTEQLWDMLLTAGMHVYGVAADDAHYFKLPYFTTYYRGTFTLPGSGWIMVNARELSSTAIVGAIDQGRFYATTGVILKDVSYNQQHYKVAVDWPATDAALASTFVTEAARCVPASGMQGLTIEFIGRGGQVLKTTHDDTAEIAVEPADGYVRARVTFVAVLKTRLDDAPTPHRFTAWTQPVFATSTPPRT